MIDERPEPVLNARSGRVVAARRLLRRSARRDAGRLLVEGPSAVSAVLAAGPVYDLFATGLAAERHDHLLGIARASGVRVSIVDDAAAASLSETVTPQGLVAVADLPRAGLAQLPDQPHPGQPYLVVVLLEPRDPGNAGTIIRTADAAGADAVVLAGDSVDPWGGKCVRASAGSVFHLPVVDAVPLDAVLGRLVAAGCRVLAADAGGASLDDEIDAGRLAEPTAWLLGNEAHGLSPGVLRASDQVVAVPVYGQAESLNLAAAAAVCLYASARAQRRGPQAPGGRPGGSRTGATRGAGEGLE